ncbi:MAG TPA: oxidoreductase [Flavobacteriales bacterium]|nr:oxidoreductase [Flavobacteriales bacterium]
MKLLLNPIYLLLFSFHLFSQSQPLDFYDSGVNSSFRALSVVDDSIAWLAGSDGWIGLTTNGGNSWAFYRVKGRESQDFRSLYAFDDKKAVIANAGTPAEIWFTGNGGKDWNIVFTDNAKDAFFDGIDFWDNQKGLAYGDPAGDKLSLLFTDNGGETWSPIPEENRPSMSSGEASFAASGTGIRTYKNGQAMISTGGMESGLWKSLDFGHHWQRFNAPIVKGKNSAGIFSHHFNSEHTGIIVGGDYLESDEKTDHVFYTMDGGKTWIMPEQQTRGYRECVEFIRDSTFMATGTNGIDITTDNGKNWTPLSDEKNLHVLRKARNGSLILVAGSHGRIARIKN